jgi:2-polyprenyl-3-methyl-5-hydroxy-6-metoxy-1,4-benzoquinol methylase
LYLNLVPYRRPFSYYNTEVWNRGYSFGEHDHYEGISDRPRYGAIVSYLCALPGKLEILDIGCGTGILRERIPDERVDFFLGVDTSSSAIELARRRSFPRSQFEVSGIPEQGQFDAIVCNEMLYLVEDPDTFLDQLRPRLRAGGFFITSNTRFHGDFALRAKIEARFRKVDEAIVINPDHKRKWRVGCYC